MSKSSHDKIVLQALNRSDENAFEKVYTDYYKQLTTYLLGFSIDREKVEDIVQDTFVYLWSKRKEIIIKTSLKSYLYKIAYNKLNDWYRTDKKKNKMLTSYYHTEKIFAVKSNEAYMDSQLDKLDACICVLPPRCKDVFIANKISGKKYKEVALDMDISIRTVENHISKAYRLLKNCISE